MESRSVKGQRDPVFSFPFGNDRLGGNLFCVESRTNVVYVCDLAQGGNRAVSAPFPVRSHFLGDIQDPTDNGKKIRFSQRILNEGCAPALQGAEFGERRLRNFGIWRHRHLERIAETFQSVNAGCDCTHALEVFQSLHSNGNVQRKHDADDCSDHLNPCSPRCLIHCPELPFGSGRIIAGGPVGSKRWCCP